MNFILNAIGSWPTHPQVEDPRREAPPDGRIRRIAKRYVPGPDTLTLFGMRSSVTLATYLAAWLAVDYAPALAKPLGFLAHMFAFMTLWLVVGWVESVTAHHVKHGVKKVFTKT